MGGAADASDASRFGEVTDPATGDVVARVPLATATDVTRAVELAAQAGRSWAAASLSKRTDLLFRFRALVQDHRRSLAELVTREHGKVRSDAAAEVQRGLEVVDFACGVGELLNGEMSDQVSRGVDSYSLRQPVGVAAGITPFNFPVMVPMWMFPIALAAGNAFILKPSEQTPSASMLLARLLAALPKRAPPLRLGGPHPDGPQLRRQGPARPHLPARVEHAALGARRSRPAHPARRRAAAPELRADRKAPRAPGRESRDRAQAADALLLRPARRRDPLPECPGPASAMKVMAPSTEGRRPLGCAPARDARLSSLRMLGRARSYVWPPPTGRPPT
jgi:hypothetical protein